MIKNLEVRRFAMSRQIPALLFCLLRMVNVTNEFNTDRFYQAVKYHYLGKPTNEESVSGNGTISEIDLAGSEAFIKNILSWTDPPGTARALDCGAGIGRVTKHVLLKFFHKIDLLEQNEQFANAALDLIGKNNYEQLGYLYRTKVQDFYPDQYYDVIWIQWLLTHLTDRDAISLLTKCRWALKPKGVVVIKDNLSMKLKFNEEQYRISRNYKDYMSLLKAAGLWALKSQEEFLAPNYEHLLALAVVPATHASQSQPSP